MLARVLVEMVARANARRLDVAGAVELDWRVVDPSRSSEPSESVEAVESSASKGKGSQWADLVESVAPSASTQTKAKAVAILMKRDTALHADIIDVLKAGGVTCPPSMPSNLGRSYLPKYATESDVAEILAKLETEHCKTQ